jgi:hypothetical protein
MKGGGAGEDRRVVRVSDIAGRWGSGRASQRETKR